jgi:hypothetical protein
MAIVLSDNRTFEKQNNYNLFQKMLFRYRVRREWKRTDRRLAESLRKKKCYVGPFKGEFGHMTAHTAPFLMYLHKCGVEIVYCGMEIHLPLLIDDKGNSIITDFRPLRDFFSEVSPKGNSTQPPHDVQIRIDAFEREAKESGLPFWNLGDNFYYWFVHRNWILNGYTHTYDLSKVYGKTKENSVVIFPRTKGADFAPNNGKRWDYKEVIETVRPYFEKVYICGHPSQCESISPYGNVELCVSGDNRVMLEKCAESALIITQHSGVNNIGEYVRTKVLIIYSGGKNIDNIGSIYNTLRFRPSLGGHFPLSFAFSLQEIARFCELFQANKYITPVDWDNTANSIDDALMIQQAAK